MLALCMVSLYSKDLLLKIPIAEYKDGFIEVYYVPREGFFTQCKNFLQGDMSILKNTGKWFLKKGLNLICMPTTLVYCIILYFIFKVYRIVKSFDSLCASEASQDNQVLVHDITMLLYKKAKRNKNSTVELEKKKLKNMLESYQVLSSILTHMNIRKLFWYNDEYEKTISQIQSLLF